MASSGRKISFLDFVSEVPLAREGLPEPKQNKKKMQKEKYQSNLALRTNFLVERVSEKKDFSGFKQFLHPKSAIYLIKSNQTVLFYLKPGQTAANEKQFSNVRNCFATVSNNKTAKVYPIREHGGAYRIQNQDRICIFASPKLS